MAMLGGIPIADRHSQHSSGAAFLLVKASKGHELIPICDHASLEVRPEIHYVVARFSGAVTPEEALEFGHELVQQGLDLLSILGKDDLTIRDATGEHLIWWRDSDMQVLRVVSTSTLNFDVPPARLIIHDQEGNEVQTPEVAPKYHQAFRYFRLSQITEDLYDAYRNIYLAFELLLSSQYPKSNKEKEVDWLRRGITEADSSLNLSALLSPLATEPIQAIMQIIYHDTRLPLFHAKQGRDFYPPQSSQHRQAVGKALRLLTSIVLRMSESWYNARRLSGGVFSSWVYKNATQLFSSARILMSDDPSKFDPAQADLSHDRYRTAVWLNTDLLSNSKEGKGPTILGKFVFDNTENITCVRRFEVVNEKAPLVAHILENVLTLAGIDQLECQFDMRVSNVRQPKNLFPR